MPHWHTMRRATFDEIREHRGWFFVLAALLVVLGMGAILFPLVATLASDLLIGWVLLFAGVAQAIHAFRLRRWRGFLLELLGGLLALAIGAALLLFPVAGMLSLTLLTGAFFLINGMFRIALAFRVQPANGWGWLLFAGIVSLLLGILVIAQWPAAAAWLLGLLVGIDLLLSGWALMWLALGAGRAGDPLARLREHA